MSVQIRLPPNGRRCARERCVWLGELACSGGSLWSVCAVMRLTETREVVSLLFWSWTLLYVVCEAFCSVTCAHANQAQCSLSEQCAAPRKPAARVRMYFRYETRA